jgi:hypothetical protein
MHGGGGERRGQLSKIQVRVVFEFAVELVDLEKVNIVNNFIFI